MWATLEPDVIQRLPREMVSGVAPSAQPTGATESLVAQGWKKCIDALLDIRVLEHDWDGQGSPAPAPEVVDSAIILAVLLRQKHVQPPSHTVQDVQGCVNLHWQWSDYTTLDIDVMEPNLADVYLLAPNQPAEHWQIGGSAAA